MFRRLSKSLPKDPEFPADLEALGYYLNEKDQIRSISRPDQGFNFFISKNDRVNEVQREAMHTCIREILRDRFEALHLNRTRLPLTASPTDPHVPILTSPNISTAGRTILYFGEELQDLGVLAYRAMDRESLSAGSVLNLVSAIQSSKDNPGIIIANLGQLYWYRRGGRAVSRVSWSALPRKTGVSQPMRVQARNRIPGNEDMAAHVKYVFEAVVPQMVNQAAKLDILAVGEGASEAVEYLQWNWERWAPRVHAVVVGTGTAWPGANIENEKFALFWAKRARAYLVSSEPLGTPLSGREDFGCNCYSAGTPIYSECILPAAYKAWLSFLQLTYDVPGYEEMEFPQVIPKEGKTGEDGEEGEGEEEDSNGGDGMRGRWRVVDEEDLGVGLGDGEEDLGVSLGQEEREEREGGKILGEDDEDEDEE